MDGVTIRDFLFNQTLLHNTKKKYRYYCDSYGTSIDTD